jgi:septum formation protein
VIVFVQNLEFSFGHELQTSFSIQVANNATSRHRSRKMGERNLQLILASSSPQRRMLLANAGYAFRIVEPHPDAECGVCSRESPGEMVARLARQKAANVAQQLGSEFKTHEVLVACDTVAECAGSILGKPTDRDHARQMLRLLSGREHRVYSGLCLWWPDAQSPTTRVARTTLRMDNLSDEQLTEYLDSGLWEGKAGAFGYQDRVGWLQIVEGSESNVIGLPLELLAQMLNGEA